MRDAILFRDGLGGLGTAADETRDLYALDLLEPIQVLAAKCALPNHDDLHVTPPTVQSAVAIGRRIRSAATDCNRETFSLSD